MNKDNLTLEQRAKNAVKSNKSQAWKVAVVSALGLTIGGGVAAAAILHPDQDPEPTPDEEKEQEQADKDVEVVNNVTPSNHSNNSHPHVNHDDHNDHDDVALPDYLVYDQEVVTLENGSQIEVAWGVTENGRDCVIIDEDMDGKANSFIEDANGDGLVENAETIDLADNDITVSMEHLPSLDLTVVYTDTDSDMAYVVDDDPNVNIDSDDQIDVDFNPDFNTTESYDVASNDDIVADPNDNIMA